MAFRGGPGLHLPPFGGAMHFVVGADEILFSDAGIR
jgi:hypothetical protein